MVMVCDSPAVQAVTAEPAAFRSVMEKPLGAVKEEWPGSLAHQVTPDE